MDGDQRQLCFEADNYGTRMRWYITAPATGNYTFWIAGDDNSELWLSLNDNGCE